MRSISRARRALSHWATGIIIATTLLFDCGDLAAEALSRADRIRALYSNQLIFSPHGIPEMTIGIVEGSDDILLTSSSPIRVQPDGPGGSEIIGGKRWRIRRLTSRPAQVEYYLELFRCRTDAVNTLTRAIRTWKTREIGTETIEIGAVFGMKGRVFDNRILVLVTGPFKTKNAAHARGKRFLKRRWLSKTRTLEKLRRPPGGVIEASDIDRAVRVRVQDALWLAPTGSSLLSLRTARNRSGVYRGQLGGKYRGSLYVTFDRHGLLAVVNQLGTDELLAGLVSAEIFPSAPRAALEAQAVAARGNLLAKIGIQSRADPYLTCAWQRCQVYRGAGHETPRTTRAIRATRGLVLMGSTEAKLVDAVYHAHSGGFTENNENVWPGPPNPSLRGKLDAPAHLPFKRFRQGINEKNIQAWLDTSPGVWSSKAKVNSKRFRWRVRRNAATVAKGIRRVGLTRRIGPIREIHVDERGRSGRAKRVTVHGQRGRATLSGELTIRRAFGDLPSSMFIVRTLPATTGTHAPEFEFQGGGWGHGVGLCQTGAIGMAVAGKTFREILKHYYSASTLQRVY